MNWASILLAARSAVVDYVAFYSAGRILLSDHRYLLFDLAHQTKLQQEIIGTLGTLPFYHPAYESVLFAPFALLNFVVSLWTWRAFLIAVLIGSCYLLKQVFQFSFIDVVALANGCFSVVLAIVQGQDSVLILCIFSGSLLLMKNGREAWSGCIFAIALFKPQLVLPIVVAFAMKRRTTWLMSFAATATILILLSVALVGWSGSEKMVQLIVLTTSRQGSDIGVHGPEMANLRGLFSTLQLNGKISFFLTVLGSILVFLYTCARIVKENRPEFLFGPLIVATLLISFHLNLHDLTLLVIPILVIFAERLTVWNGAVVGAIYLVPMFLMTARIPFFALALIGLLWVSLPRDSDRKSGISDEKLEL